MAFFHDRMCGKCKKVFSGTDKQDYCPECNKIVRVENLENFLTDWRGNLTLEERVAKIEKWIFEFQDHSHFSSHTPIG
jgi:hypothetical protein